MTCVEWLDQETGYTARVGVACVLGNFRENNEDHVITDPTHPFVLVLDGMGGMAAGEVASQQGGDAVARALRRGLEAGERPPALIETALRAGYEHVVELGRTNPALRNMGSTVVLTLLHRGAAYVSWLGDSPAYRVSNGRIAKLTWEHDLRQALVRNGTISAEEQHDYPIRNVLWRFLGSGADEGQWEKLEIPSFTPRRSDRLLLATDGVSGVLEEADLLEVCQAHPDPQTCAEELVNLALARGSRDNCSCAVVAFESGVVDPAPEPPRPARKWWQFWK